MFRALCSELRLPHNEWSKLKKSVQHEFNNYPLPDRKGKALNTIFIGHKPQNNVSSFHCNNNRALKTLTDV